MVVEKSNLFKVRTLGGLGPESGRGFEILHTAPVELYSNSSNIEL
jgi:hypothetical protein